MTATRSSALSAARASCNSSSRSTVTGFAPPSTRRAVRAVSSSVVTASWRSSSVVTGDAVGPELEAQVEEIFRYNADDPRFCRAKAAELEASTRGLIRDQAYADECADSAFEGGGDVTPADVERELGNIKPGKVPHPGDGIQPEGFFLSLFFSDRRRSRAFLRRP